MSENLIPVTVKNNQQLVSARDLYRALQIKTRFSLWVKQNFKGFKDHLDFEGVVTTTPYNPSHPQGKQQKIQDYYLTIETAKKIAMMAKTKIGDKVRDYFIEVEKRYQMAQIHQQSLSQPDSYMISDPIKRARRWIQEREAFEDQKRLTQKQAKQLKDQEDDVLFSKTMIATNHASSIRELAAKRLGHGNTITTQKVYIHLLDKLRNEDNSKIAALLDKLGA